jgi:hypothetical protein
MVGTSTTLDNFSRDFGLTDDLPAHSSLLDPDYFRTHAPTEGEW